MCAQDRNANIGLAHKVDIRTSDEVLVPEQICFANLGLAHKVDIRASDKVLVPEQICCANLGLAHKVDIRTSYKVLVPEQNCCAILGLAHKVSGFTPDFARCLDHQSKFGALCLDGDIVAVHRAGEAALG